MTFTIAKATLLGAVAVMLLTGLVFPTYPLVALSFEAGIVVGLLLHSSHTKSASERGRLAHAE